MVHTALDIPVCASSFSSSWLYRQVAALRDDRARQRRLRREYSTVAFEGSAWADSACEFESGVVVHDDAVILHARVGRSTYFGTGARIHLAEFGRYCSIGHQVYIGAGRHPSRDFVSTHPFFYAAGSGSGRGYVAQDRFVECLPTEIGHDVWIGAGSFITDGITIGNGAIIGAGAVVTRDVAPYSVVGGVPARLIRQRFSDADTQFLQDLKWWNRDESWIARHAYAFDSVDALRRAMGIRERV